MASLERQGDHCMRYKRVKCLTLHFAVLQTHSVLSTVEHLLSHHLQQQTNFLSNPAVVERQRLIVVKIKIKGNVFQE